MTCRGPLSPQPPRACGHSMPTTSGRRSRRRANASPVLGTQTVRYGSGSTWITMQVNGSGECSNGAFGGDPLYGVVKECQTESSGDGGWTAIAGEHSSFTVNGTQTVRYGSGTSWLTQSVSGAGECSNEFFGVDPLYGVVKECQVASADTAPPVTRRGRSVHATRGCGRHVRHGRDGRRRQRGELHRSRPARRRRVERGRQVQLRVGSGDDRDLPHDRRADHARHGHRRREPGHPRWRRQRPNLQPGAAELPDQHARPHAAAHHAAQRPGTRRRIRGARSGPSELRLRLRHRQRRGDRSARRATARHRRPLPGQRCRESRAGCGRRCHLRRRLARRDDRRLAIPRQLGLECGRRRHAAEQPARLQQRVQRQCSQRRQPETSRPPAVASCPGVNGPGQCGAGGNGGLS